MMQTFAMTTMTTMFLRRTVKLVDVGCESCRCCIAYVISTSFCLRYDSGSNFFTHTKSISEHLSWYFLFAHIKLVLKSCFWPVSQNTTENVMAIILLDITGTVINWSCVHFLQLLNFVLTSFYCS